ncbi:unnamed protein product [Rangifer tarandus platyrhynchus]|uniref:Uncharacterized protein n=1 Tax=Rangifer tarandus platyrhynchus TaxID=3082113 RepID=A0AC59YF27_RANTA
MDSTMLGIQRKGSSSIPGRGTRSHMPQQRQRKTRHASMTTEDPVCHIRRGAANNRRRERMGTPRLAQRTFPLPFCLSSETPSSVGPSLALSTRTVTPGSFPFPLPF